MEYVINGVGTYAPDPSYVSFRRIEHLFEKKAEAACQEYVRYHNENFKTFDQFIEGANSAAHQIFYQVIDEAVAELIRYEVYDVSRETFLSKYIAWVGIADWEEAYSDAEALYHGIREEEEATREARAERKEGRGRSVATIRGGDSVESMLKGYIGAELLNIGVGMLHSGVNAAQNVFTRKASERKKTELYTDEIMMEMATSVYVCVEQFKYAFVDALSEHASMVFSEPSADEYKRAADMARNILDGSIPQERRAEVLRQILALDPLNREFMKYVLKTYGDTDGSYRALCETLSFDIDNVKRELLLEDFSEEPAQITTKASFYGFEEQNLSGLSLYTADMIADRLLSIHYDDKTAFQKDAAGFLEWAKKGILDISPYEAAFRKIEKIIGKTVDGCVYSSMKKAQESAAFLEALCQKISSASGNDVKTIEAVLAELEDASVLSKDKYITYLKDELEKESRRFCHVKGVDYTDREVAKQAREDALALDGLLKEIALSDRDAVERTLTAVKEIASPDLKEIYVSFLECCLTLLEEQSAAIRTSAAVEYATRREAADMFYPEWTRKQKAEYLRVLLPEYGQWFDDLYRHYVTVKQICVTPQEADRKYFSMIKNARSYLNYISKKQAGGSVFSKIKTGVTGIVYEGYQKDYDAATAHGSREIPRDDLQEDQKATEELAATCAAAVEAFQKEIADRYARVSLPGAMEEHRMSADGLYLGTKTDMDVVCGILREACDCDLTAKLQEQGHAEDHVTIDDQAEKGVC